MNTTLVVLVLAITGALYLPWRLVRDGYKELVQMCLFCSCIVTLAAARPSPQHPDKSRPARRYAPARPLNRAVVTGHCSGGGIV